MNAEGGELFVNGVKVADVVSFSIQMEPVAISDDQAASLIEAIGTEGPQIEGNLTFPVPDSQAQRIRYKLGGGPAWQYPAAL